MNEERAGFRQTIGLVAIVGGIAALVPLYFVPVPEGNKDALLLAIGIVLGWGATIINGEWGSSPAGRAAATKGLRDATGKPGDPVHTQEEK